MPDEKLDEHAQVSAKVKELVKSGRDPKQAIAVALAEQRAKKKGIPVEGEEEELVDLDDEEDEEEDEEVPAVGTAEEVAEEPKKAEPIPSGPISESALEAIKRKKLSRKYD